jgi:hypothetical protein
VHKKQQQTLRCNRVVSDSSTGNSISQYLIQAAKRFVPFCRKEDEELMSDNTLRRFERLADGADSFFRLVESGGHPNKSVFLPPPLTRALLAGDSMEFLIQTKTGSDHIMVWPWLDHPDAKSGSGLQACLTVTREDEVVWQKGFKMSVLFRLSEASNILAIAMSCLELLPPQFDAARVAISRLLIETIGQSGDHSSLSERSKWCCRQIVSYHRNDSESSMGDDKHKGNGMLLLSQPVLRLTALCYASPCIDRKDGLPLELECHVSPYLLPEKHSSQYELVEQDVIRKLLPNVTDGFYDDDDRQPLSYQRQIWSPQSSMYCAVTPAFKQPLTVSQAYQMECSGTRSRRRRTAKTKSQSISNFQKMFIASVPH